eukprot:1974525-Amphidinium_carterae.1
MESCAGMVEGRYFRARCFRPAGVWCVNSAETCEVQDAKMPEQCRLPWIREAMQEDHETVKTITPGKKWFRWSLRTGVLDIVV